MLGERFARSAFERSGEPLARELASVLAAGLPREDAASWLGEVVEELAGLGHLLRLEDDTDGALQVWGDFAVISCDVIGHDLALFAHGRFEGATPIRIDRIEVLWRRT